MTDAERSYLTNLLRFGRATLYALKRDIRYTDDPATLTALVTDAEAIRADVSRLELVLGV